VVALLPPVQNATRYAWLRRARRLDSTLKKAIDAVPSWLHPVFLGGSRNNRAQCMQKREARSDQSAGGKVPASLLMALMDVPAFRTIVDSSSPESLRRLRMIFTCTRSLKSRELRKYVGLRRFIFVAYG
jgi:hypothetical protein